MPAWGKNAPREQRKVFPPLPKRWRRLIQEAITERQEAIN